MTVENIDARAIRDAIAQILKTGSRGALLTTIASTTLTVGSKLLVREGGAAIGDLGSGDLNEAASKAAAEFLRTRVETVTRRADEFAPGAFGETLILFERIENEPRLVIAGAGHVGAALARLAGTVGYRVILIDDRPEFVDARLFQEDPNLELMTTDDWTTAVAAAVGDGRGVSVAIVTRGHKQDEECLRAAVAAAPDYIGMIGSKRRTNIVLDKLREEGFSGDQLQNVRAPIGLDIGAVSPEEVALAILAEIVAERRGGSGQPLSGWRRA